MSEKIRKTMRMVAQELAEEFADGIDYDENELLVSALVKCSYGDFDSAFDIMDNVDVDDLVDTFLNDKKPSKEIVDNIEILLKISQSMFNNYRADGLVLSDDDYNDCIEKFKRIRKEPVGASPSKRERTSKHDYPNLRGTLDKCKFVYNDKDMNDDDTSVEDFIRKPIKLGLVNVDDDIEVAVSYKYDGLSIVATLNDGFITSANTRGDEDNGADVTNLFENTKFDSISDKPVGVKFEAIVTHKDLKLYNKEKGREYVNCRSAITSIVTALDGYKYSKYITLVPLDYDDGKTFSRKARIKNLADFVSYDGQEFIYKIFRGPMKKVLKDIKEEIENIDNIRKSLTYDIDGVVIEFLDKEIIKSLGRKNSINQYQIAYKFPSEIKRTKVTDLNYTVGHTGLLTPMLYFEPIYFNGNKYDHCSISSKNRFNKLNLRKGDVIEVKYSNDVMPYVVRNVEELNRKNQNPILKYPEQCVICGSQLVDSESNKNSFCVNPECESVKVRKLTEFINRMGFRDFSEKTIERLYESGLVLSIPDLFSLTVKDLTKLESFDTIKATNLIEQIGAVKKSPISPIKLISSLALNNIGPETCNKIFSKYSLSDVIEFYDKLTDGQNRVESILYDMSTLIGEKTAITFFTEFGKQIKIIRKLQSILNIIHVEDDINFIKVCFTGFRPDDDLKKLMKDKGYKSVESLTKACKYLVMNDGYSSKKIKEAKDKGVSTINLSEFMKILEPDNLHQNLGNAQHFNSDKNGGAYDMNEQKKTQNVKDANTHSDKIGKKVNEFYEATHMIPNKLFGFDKKNENCKSK